MAGADEVRLAVVDASIAVKWVVDEPYSAMAAALLDRPITWLAPRLMLVEAAAALRRKVSERELSPVIGTAALRSIADATRDGTVQLADDEQLVTEAFLLALDLGHKVPDCLYLALAEREGCALATADRRLASLARSRKVPVLGVGNAATVDRAR
jgi:predicted nucleic acid-binding protein